MYCFRTTVTTDKGDALVGWQLECVQNDNLTTPVTIYSDESSTPIASISGVSNRAVTDSAGNAYFFVEDGLYGIRYYDSQGVYQRTERYFSMFGGEYVQNITDTWANAGTTYYGVKVNITFTAAASGSRLLSLQVGGTEKAGVDKDGNVTAAGSIASASNIFTGAGSGVWLSGAGAFTTGVASSSGNMELYTSSNARVRIDTSGNVLIGSTATPSGTGVNFQVSGSTTIRNWLSPTGGRVFYLEANATANALQFVDGTAAAERLRLKSDGQLRFVPLAADPAGAENGDVYYNSTTNKLRVYAAGAWVDLH